MGVRTSYRRDWRLRALIACGYIGAPGMEEAMYVTVEANQTGRPLDGNHAYRLRFAAARGVNWLPVPAKKFYVTLRLYLPRSSHLERRFVYPAVTLIET